MYYKITLSNDHILFFPVAEFTDWCKKVKVSLNGNSDTRLLQIENFLASQGEVNVKDWSMEDSIDSGGIEE